MMGLVDFMVATSQDGNLGGNWGFEASPDYVFAILSWSGLGLSSLRHASCPKMVKAMMNRSRNVNCQKAQLMPTEIRFCSELWAHHMCEREFLGDDDNEAGNL